jgi:hypothetical protein
MVCDDKLARERLSEMRNHTFLQVFGRPSKLEKRNSELRTSNAEPRTDRLGYNSGYGFQLVR